MDPDPPGGGKLDRLGDLLAGLGAALGTGDILGWASPGAINAVPDEVFRVVTNAGLMADGDPRRRRPVIIPADGAALMERMWEVDEPAAIGLLTTLAASTQPSRPRRHHPGRRYEDEPQDIFAEIASLTGPDTRWWTNTDLTRWNPITQHDFDAVIVAAGGGIIVTLIAFEGGE